MKNRPIKGNVHILDQGKKKLELYWPNHANGTVASSLLMGTSS